MPKPAWFAPTRRLTLRRVNTLRPAAVLLLLPLAAAAQIYKWTDANGQVHFSQNPPASGAYKDVTPDLPPPTVTPHVDSLRKAAESYAQQDADAQKQRTAMLKAKADNAERCAKARERVRFLDEHPAHRLYKTGDDGQPARLTDEDYQQQVGDAQAAAAKYCD